MSAPDVAACVAAYLVIALVAYALFRLLGADCTCCNSPQGRAIRRAMALFWPISLGVLAILLVAGLLDDWWCGPENGSGTAGGGRS